MTILIITLVMVMTAMFCDFFITIASGEVIKPSTRILYIVSIATLLIATANLA